jgi:hypothetical protein
VQSGNYNNGTTFAYGALTASYAYDNQGAPDLDGLTYVRNLGHQLNPDLRLETLDAMEPTGPSQNYPGNYTLA